MARFRKWWKDASPGEIVQVGTGILALFATLAAAAAAIFTYQLSQNTERRLSSAVVEISTGVPMAQVAYVTDSFGRPQPEISRLDIELPMTIRNLGGVAATLQGFDFSLALADDPNCLSSAEKSSSTRLNGRVPDLIAAGAAKAGQIRGTYRFLDLARYCKKATVAWLSERLVRGIGGGP